MNELEQGKKLFFEALSFLDASDFQGAELRLREALRFAPGSVPVLTNLALALLQQNKHDEAREFAEKVIATSGNNIEALMILGDCYAADGKLSEALALYEKCISLDQTIPEAYNNCGIILAKQGLLIEALENIDRAITLDANFSAAHTNRGNTLRDLRRYDDAFIAYDKALALDPNLADAWLGRGNIFFDLKRHDEAIAAYDRAIALNPDLAAAWNGRGSVFFETKRFDEALAAFDRAFTLQPDLLSLEGTRLHTKMQLCDWNNFDAECAHLVSSVKNKKLNSEPFPLLTIPFSAEEQFQYVKLWTSHKYPATYAPIWRGERYNHDRIRVAYLSTDYRLHPIAYLISEVLELHDRTKIEVFGISIGPDDKSDMRSRIIKAFDQFHDARSQGDHEIAQLIRRLEIDILVDLNNFSDMCRPGILARRPAPIQVSYLGYPSTMGADFMDYAIVDEFVLPPEQQMYWTEKFVYMPDSYLVHDTRTKQNMPSQPPSRAQAGLPEKAFVFCCFNNSFKITPTIFQIWMRLLKAVNGSVAWFSSAAMPASRYLRMEAERAGVDADRLIFAPKTDRVEDHLSRHRVADLFLDTQFYNAHTTAADALWAGLPVVTCAGTTFPSRVAGSLLHAIGVPELVTETLQDYEALALQLARDPTRLAEIKAKLVHNRDTLPLFDTPRFTRHLEAAYMSMVERHRAGLAPSQIFVPN